MSVFQRSQHEDESHAGDNMTKYSTLGNLLITDEDEVGLQGQFNHVLQNEEKYARVYRAAKKQAALPTGSKTGTRIGQFAGGAIYAASYPITWVDGPLPIVDVAWAYGAVKAVRMGGRIGNIVGEVVGLD